MATVTLEGISKYFGAAPAVQDLSCTIAQGEFLALLGPSGCGKTTTLLMLAGIYRPASGTLRFDGRIVNDLPPRQRNIGMVFQSYALYPHLTVYENLAFPLRIQRQSRALIASAPGEHLLPATLTLLEPLGREVLLSVTCGPHRFKVLVPAPCGLAPDTPVWLNLSQGPHHFFDLHTGVALV